MRRRAGRGGAGKRLSLDRARHRRAFDRRGLPVVDETTMQSTNPRVFFGGDAAFGPKNIIWAVAHGHQAAISIDLLCSGEDVRARPPPGVTLVSQKMGIHEWSYDNDIRIDRRYRVPHQGQGRGAARHQRGGRARLRRRARLQRGERCLNCDVQTAFTARSASNATRAWISARWTASPSPRMARRRTCASGSTRRRKIPTAALCLRPLKTGRVMVKDEDVCLHCGLCAERCPTGAWDMQRFFYDMAQAGHACRSR